MPRPVVGSGKQLLGRGRQRGVLDRLLTGVCGGRGADLMLHGEAGVGKTAPLEYVAEAGRESRIARTVATEAEM
jgi:hypothetical protein